MYKKSEESRRAQRTATYHRNSLPKETSLRADDRKPLLLRRTASATPDKVSEDICDFGEKVYTYLLVLDNHVHAFDLSLLD